MSGGMAEIYEGGCLCGAVRWRATGAPTTIGYCHCEMCRRASGAPVTAWATFAVANVEFTRVAPALRPSSDIASRGFCAACGSALLWRGKERADFMDLAVGTADEPERLAPREHLWTENAISWLRVEDALPRHRRERKA
jgi:hypothetical protein